MLFTRKLEDAGLDPKLAMPILLLLSVAVVVWLMMATGRTLQPISDDKTPLPIDAFQVEQKTIDFKVHSQGTVEPRTESDLVSEVDGVVSWKSPNFIAGGIIRRGETLLKLDKADYETARARAKASLARSKAQFERADSELIRITQLNRKKLASKSQLDTANSDYEVAKANLAEAEANLRQAIRDIARTELKAPYDGLVRSKQVDQGQYLSRGTVVGRLYATDFLEVRLPIADSELAFLDQYRLTGPDKEKPEVVLSAKFAGVQKHWSGYIDRLEASIDTRSRMVLAVARIQAGAEQAPPVGLFVKAAISGRSEANLFAIPRAALRDRGTVLIVNKDKMLEPRQVDIIRIDGEQLIIKSGLSDGDILSTSISPTLAPGSVVEPSIINPRPALQLEGAAAANTRSTDRL